MTSESDGAALPEVTSAPVAEYRMPIGYDIDLLCDAVTMAAGGYVMSLANVQRRIRVGFVKADRLLLLMDNYGITGGPPLRRQALIAQEELPAKLAELREIASRENEAQAPGGTWAEGA